MKHCAFLILIGLLLACGNNRKPAPLPIIELLEAPQEFNLVLPDTIRLKLRLRAEEGLQALKVDLLSLNLVPMTDGKVYGLAGTTAELEVVFPIADPLLDDGNYWLGLNLSSRRESSNSFVRVNLTGIPRRVTGAVFVAVQGNTTRIYQLDSNLQQPRLAQSLPLSTAHVLYDVPGNRLLLAAENNQNMLVYQPADSSLSTALQSLPAPGFPTYTHLSLGPQLRYIGRGQGNVVGIDRNLQQRLLYNLPEGYYPGFVQHLGERLLVEMRPNLVNGFRRLQLVEPERLGLIREMGLNGPVLGAHRLNENQLLVLVQEGGQGKLFRYTVSISRWESETGPDNRNYRAMLSLSNGQLALLHDGLSLYTPGSSVRTGQFTTLSNQTFAFISFDPLGNRLLAIQGQQAQLISLGNGGGGQLNFPEEVQFGYVLRSRP
jgi:hypothetical protein